jgi:hypothetical protein
MTSQKCIACFNIQWLNILLTGSVYRFHTVLRIKRDFFFINRIERLVCVMEKHCVYCMMRTKFVCIIWMNFMLQRIILNVLNIWKLYLITVLAYRMINVTSFEVMWTLASSYECEQNMAARYAWVNNIHICWNKSCRQQLRLVHIVHIKFSILV